jgi:hypothetical protein
MKILYNKEIDKVQLHLMIFKNLACLELLGHFFQKFGQIMTIIY